MNREQRGKEIKAALDDAYDLADTISFSVKELNTRLESVIRKLEVLADEHN